MKKIFVISIIFLICIIGKAATDSNNMVLPDSNITVPDINTVAGCQEKIIQLELVIKSQKKRLTEILDSYNNIRKRFNEQRKELDEQRKEFEKLRTEATKLREENAELKKQIGGSASSIQFTGEETPLTIVEAYPRKYIGKTFIVIGGINVSTFYHRGYSEASGTHISLGFDELRQDGSRTDKHMQLYVKREIAKSLIEEITKTIYSGDIVGKLIRVKASILRYDPSDPSMDDGVELINWQFRSSDKKSWQDWAISEGHN